MMSRDITQYRGNSGVRIRETRDGLELAIQQHSEVNAQWTRIEVSKELLLLIRQAIDNYSHSIVIADKSKNTKSRPSG